MCRTKPAHLTTIELTPAERERGQREHEYAMRVRQYRTGEVTEEQWQQYLLEADFQDWLRSL